MVALAYLSSSLMISFLSGGLPVPRLSHRLSESGFSNTSRFYCPHFVDTARQMACKHTDTQKLCFRSAGLSLRALDWLGSLLRFHRPLLRGAVEWDQSLCFILAHFVPLHQMLA